MNLVFCLLDPLDRHNQASGYSICYNGSGFLNLMANSSGQKMNFKMPMFFISHTYINQIGTFQILQILWFYKDCKVLHKVTWGTKKETGLNIEKNVQTFTLIQPWERMRWIVFLWSKSRSYKFSRNFQNLFLGLSALCQC